MYTLNSRKKLFTCLFIMLFGAIAHAQKSVGHHDLMMILGHEYDVGAMTWELVQALHNQAYPVIVSKQILHNYLNLIKKTEIIAHAKFLKSKIIECADQGSQWIDLEGKKQKDGYILLGKLISNDDWYGYHTPQSNLILLLPKSYIKQHIDPSITLTDDQVRACGFNVGKDGVVRVGDMTPNKLEEIIFNARLAMVKKPQQAFIEHVRPFFIATKKSGNKSCTHEFWRWNVFVTGHGFYALKYDGFNGGVTLNFARDTANYLTNMLVPPREKFIKRCFKACKAYLFPVAILPSVKLWDYLTRPDKRFEHHINFLGRPINDIADLLNKTYGKRFKCDKKTQKIYLIDNIEYEQEKAELFERMFSAPNEQGSLFLASSSIVAGVQFDDFADLMRFFNEEVHTSYLHYSTCYAGGFNRTFVNKILHDMQVDFIVSSTGVSELEVFNHITMSFIVDERNNLTPTFYCDFKKFFDQLRWYQNQEGHSYFREAEVGQILKKVVAGGDIVKTNNQPFVRFPQDKKFSAVDVDDSITILNNQKIKSYQAQECIDMREHKAILVYPACVKQQIILDDKTLIMSGLEPEIASGPRLGISVDYEMIQFFESVVYEGDILDFISNLAAFNAVNNKVFLINTLQHLYDFDAPPDFFKNVVIQIFVKPEGAKSLAGTIIMRLMFEECLYEIKCDCDDVSKPDFSKIAEIFKLQPDAAIKSHIETFNSYASRAKASAIQSF